MIAFQGGSRHVMAFIRGMSLRTVPAEVVEQAKICLLDLIGACIAGRHAKGAAILLDLCQEQTLNTLGIAESYAPLTPVMRSVASPAMAPKDGVPWGAMTGVSAALLARRGYTGSPSLLGDPEYNSDVFTLGAVWRIMHLYFKPFPCCRWTQPSVDAVLSLLKDANIRPREISRIIIHTFAEAAALSKEIPWDLESAEYNIRFPVAAAIVYGEFTPAHLDEIYFQDDAVLDIFELIETRIDPDIQDQFPEKCQSRVEIYTESGRVADSGLMPARGDWDGIPLSRAELEAKFLSITKGLLEPDAARRLMKSVRNFESHQTRDLIPYLA